MNKPLVTIQVGEWTDGSHWQAQWDNGKRIGLYGIGRVGNTRQEAMARLFQAMIEQGYIKVEPFGDKT